MPAAQVQAELRGNPADFRQAMIGEGAAGAFTIAGITTKDRILSVWKVSIPADVITCTDVTGTFTITGNNTVNSGATSLVDSFALVTWLKTPRGR
jgi:hypothetical protein